MINLKVQITSLFFSFLFGFAFSFFLFFIRRIIYNKFNFIKLFGSFIIVITSFMLYFYFMQIIDNSFFHFYHLFMIAIGFIFNRFLIKIVKIKKK